MNIKENLMNSINMYRSKNKKIMNINKKLMNTNRKQQNKTKNWLKITKKYLNFQLNKTNSNQY